MELCDLDLLLIRSSILSICAAHHYVLDSSLRASSPLRAGSYIFICSSYLTINLSNLFSVVDPWYPIAIDEWAICLLPHLSRGRVHTVSPHRTSVLLTGSTVDTFAPCSCTFYRRSICCSVSMQVFTPHPRDGFSVLTYHAPIYCTAYGFSCLLSSGNIVFLCHIH
jgi:hypothetical protein